MVISVVIKDLFGSLVIATEQFIHTIMVKKTPIIIRHVRVPVIGVLHAEMLERQRLQRMPHSNCWSYICII